MFIWREFWNDIGNPLWPNLLASVVVWLFLKAQTAALREIHEFREQESERRHKEMLNAVNSSPTTVVNNPEEVIIEN